MSRHAGWLVLWLASSVTVLCSTSLRAEEPTRNLELMTRLTAEVVERLVADMPQGFGDRGVLLVAQGADERYEFIGNGFGRVLTQRGIRTLTSGARARNDSTATGFAAAGVELQYQALDFTLGYPKIYRPFLIGGKKVKRSARVSLLVKVLDPTDRSVVWVGEAAASNEDQFAYKDLPAVEAGVFEFTKPPRKEMRLGKIVEPVVVGGIIVGLIYLFFSNQNSN